MQFEDFEATARAVLAAETALTRAASFFGSALSASGASSGASASASVSASASGSSSASASGSEDAAMTTATSAASAAEPGTPAYFASLAAQAVELGVPNLAAGAALPGAFVTLHIANVSARVAERMCALARAGAPLIASGLFQVHCKDSLFCSTSKEMKRFHAIIIHFFSPTRHFFVFRGRLSINICDLLVPKTNLRNQKKVFLTLLFGSSCLFYI